MLRIKKYDFGELRKKRPQLVDHMAKNLANSEYIGSGFRSFVMDYRQSGGTIFIAWESGEPI